MTGRDLSGKLHYIGMEKAVRLLAIRENLAKTEDLAIMSIEEVCDLVAEKYEIVYAESEKIGLVKKMISKH